MKVTFFFVLLSGSGHDRDRSGFHRLVVDLRHGSAAFAPRSRRSSSRISATARRTRRRRRRRVSSSSGFRLKIFRSVIVFIVVVVVVIGHGREHGRGRFDKIVAQRTLNVMS